MSTYNRRYISMDDSTTVANKDASLFLEDTQINILLEFKNKLENFNFKWLTNELFLKEPKLTAYNELNNLITLLNKLLNTHIERSKPISDTDTDFSKIPFNENDYNSHKDQIADIKTKIINRGKGKESTTSLNDYISGNNIIKLLLRLFETQTRIPPTKDEIKEHIKKMKAEREAKRQAEIEEAKQIVVKEANILATLRKQAVDGLGKVRENEYREGGKKSKKIPKKEILGKMRCIYKIPGDRKEYLKHKGKLITVKEYKELMKAKLKKKEVKPKKVKKIKSKK